MYVHYIHYHVTWAHGPAACIFKHDGVGNVALGFSSMAVGNAGNYNIGVGNQTLVDVAGSNNIAIGFQSLFDLTSGANNIAVGHQALKTANGVELQNIAIGTFAMLSVDEGASQHADNNVAIGYSALTGGAVSGGDFIDNIAIGKEALNSTGTNPHTGTIAIGANALTGLTSGGENLAIGYQAMKTMTTGAANIAIGYETMDALNHADADANIAIGNNVLGAAGAIALHSCVGVGHGALDAVDSADATGTIAIGRDALGALTSGNGNTAVGYQALTTNVDGDRNTAIGYGALASHEADTDGHGENTADSVPRRQRF